MFKLNQFLKCAGLSFALLHASAVFARDITGAGATFAYPIFLKWAESYKAQTGIDLNYQSIGSESGFKQIQAKAVDFGATAAPLNDTELETAGLTQFPVVIGGVVPIVNINGIDSSKLKLDGKILADIFLGKITRWNDPSIVADNAGVSLPDEPITVVHRSDSSGTTFIFTSYLTQVNLDWKNKIGANKSVFWPCGTGGKGNEGVASFVLRIKNSIGYVEYAYALQSKAVYTQLKNYDGLFVKPNAGSFKSATANAKWDTSKGFYNILTNAPGKDSWPIIGASYILVYKSQDRPENGKEVLNFFDWAFSNDDKLASDLDYVSLPANLKTMIRNAWKNGVMDASGKSLWK
jgi:phosphate transport system substrate-binding protein